MNASQELVVARDIDDAAARHAIAALRKLHFTVVQPSTKGADPMTIEAWKGGRHALVHVAAAIAPDEPSLLTPDARRAFREEAARAGAEAWEARIVMSPGLEIVRLDWWPLE